MNGSTTGLGWLFLASLVGVELVAQEAGIQSQVVAASARIDALHGELAPEPEEGDSWLDDDLLESVEIHGFLSQGFIQSNRNNFLADSKAGSFQFNELGLNFTLDLNENIFVGLQLVSRDLGTLGNNKIEVDWASLQYTYSNQLGFRVGKVKIPLGLWNETRDVDYLRTFVVLPQSIYAESRRDSMVALNGFAIEGNQDLGAYGGLGYQLSYGVGTIPEDGGVAQSLEGQTNDLFSTTGTAVDWSVTGHLAWTTPWEGLIMSFNCFGAELDLTGKSSRASGGIPAGTAMTYNSNDLFQFVCSAKYELEDWEFFAEFSRLYGDNLLSVGGTTISEKKLHVEGWYVGGTYRVNDWFDVGSYFSVEYGVFNDRAGHTYEADGRLWHNGYNRDLAISTRFSVTDNWCLKLEYHYMQGTHNLHLADNPSGMHEDWFVVALKSSVVF